jgi:phenylalanyl-tRNA synthetase beta chain
VLKALDTDGPVYGFEINLDVLPEPKRKATKTKAALEASALMPLSRDFAFVVAAGTAAGDLVRAVAGADKALIQDVRVFDVYQGTGIPEGFKSVGIEVVLQPKDKTLTDSEIEALSAQVLKAAEKATGARLRT